MVINVIKAMTHPAEESYEGCMFIDSLDKLVQEVQNEDSLLSLSADFDDSTKVIDEVSEGPISHDTETEKSKLELKAFPSTL
ncbi:hypothetical protein PIB30_114982, partial [Stylosanthes scabra]|nr:hypothetical protein [Stylosanthes scabra]